MVRVDLVCNQEVVIACTRLPGCYPSRGAGMLVPQRPPHLSPLSGDAAYRRRSTMTETPSGKPMSAYGRVALPDDVHAALSELIRTDFGEVIWRDRHRFGPIAASVSPVSGRTYLYDAVAGGKLSAAKWLVRLGGRVREPQAGVTPAHPCPWQAAMSTANPLPMLRVLLTSADFTPVDLGRCADDLLTLRQRASSARDMTAANDAYSETCQRIGRKPSPPPAGMPLGPAARR